MSSIRLLGEHPNDLAHESRKVASRCHYNHVVVVAHSALAVDLDRITFGGFAKQIREALAIAFVFEHDPFAIAPTHHVIDAALNIQPSSSCHAAWDPINVPRGPGWNRWCFGSDGIDAVQIPRLRGRLGIAILTI